ncbi:hypothetical protein B7P43_G15317 [Cryptotermes secundus]|uniref:Uncharacterized protein n=1 Tax=Cryptotermes secundus TaxID=105785 RepID=A0A2J7RBA3_9NEOP|nr:hypothetical protein B7P43_G15317 [Cryptotermes secundus]
MTVRPVTQRRTDGATHAAARKQIRNVTYVSSVRYHEAQRGRRTCFQSGRSTHILTALTLMEQGSSHTYHSNFDKLSHDKLQWLITQRLKQKATCK